MSTPEVTKAETIPIDKKQDKPSIVELKNGKVHFKQKPVSFEKQSETLQEIVRFRSMLEERISNREPPLISFPEEHKPLIAKLGHESDKTLNVLTKHIHQELLPTQDEDENKDVASAALAALPPSLVEKAIEAVLTRNNYGIDSPLGVRLPVAVCIWRWEVRNEHYDWLPKNSKEKAELRHAERVQAREDLKVLFNALPQEERDAIIDPKGSNKLPTKELNKPTIVASSKIDDATNTPQSSKTQGKKKEDAENTNQGDVKQSRPKKAVDPEKVAKEKERLEKKAARLEKERKEKEKKEKSQSLMAKFFNKPTNGSSRPARIQESAVAGPSKIVSDFERTFKPFVLHKDKTLAPVNWFVAEKKRKRRAALQAKSKEILVIDSDDEMDVDEQDICPTERDLSLMSSQERLRSALSSLPSSTSQSRPRSLEQIKRETGFQVYHPIAVRDLMSQLSEAEISGNDDLVRSILTKLSDRDLLPAKAFYFHIDARPGYFGTWTRSSKIIGPRRPFAKDTIVFDYGYDSGEEWEEEPAGEDVAEDGEEEDGDADEPDSDLDSWLVDDDEEPDLAALGQASPPPLFDDFPNGPPQKRKAEDADKKIGKKRKVVVPLVPFAKGPIFETTVGECSYDLFKPYAIQLFNDTPLSIDPFTFVSTCLEDHKAYLRTASANQSSDEAVFAVPALPPRLSTVKSAVLPGPSSSPNNTPSPSNILKKAPILPKSSFPDTYMDLLLTKITQLQASSITSLVESIYLDLREHKVKKVAIEAKVREVSEKCKDKKVWVVKSNLHLMQPAQVS